MRRASFRAGVAWIAMNDEPSMAEVEQVAELISVMLLADLFEVEPERVARDVIRYRRKHNVFGFVRS
jgi:hypothetical protein